MNQILLISRVPWIERTLGHDRAAVTHTLMGKVAFIAMLVHAGLILIMTAHYDGRSVLSEIPAMWDLGWFMVAAQAALGFFTLVVVTSLLIVRRRWRYETWHTVHLFVYVAIVLVIPHQFIEGSTFRSKGLAWWFWLALYVVAIGSWLAFRVARPLLYARRFRPVVSQVTSNADGSTTVVVTGRDLDRLGARPGQFMLWRFLAAGYWREAHPFSLSAAPGDALRITVGATSKLVDRIEATGLIRRELDADDRRASRVALTDAGRQALAAASTAASSPRPTSTPCSPIALAAKRSRKRAMRVNSSATQQA